MCCHLKYKRIICKICDYDDDFFYCENISENAISSYGLINRQHRGCIIPQAVTHSLVLLKMGKIISRNMLS